MAREGDTAEDALAVVEEIQGFDEEGEFTVIGAGVQFTEGLSDLGTDLGEALGLECARGIGGFASGDEVGAWQGGQSRRTVGRFGDGGNNGGGTHEGIERSTGGGSQGESELGQALG